MRLCGVHVRNGRIPMVRMKVPCVHLKMRCSHRRHRSRPQKLRKRLKRLQVLPKKVARTKVEESKNTSTGSRSSDIQAAKFMAGHLP